MKREIYNHLSAIPKSEFFRGNKALRNLNVALNGVVQVGIVTEYCISERWITRLLPHPETHKPYIDTMTNGLAVETVSGIVTAWYDE